MIEAQTNTNSWREVSVKVEDVLEKSEQTIFKKDEEHTESCKTVQDFLYSLDYTEGIDKDEGHYFRENEDKNTDGNNTGTYFVIKCVKYNKEEIMKLIYFDLLHILRKKDIRLMIVMYYN